MKTIKLLFVFCLFAGVASCSDDEINNGSADGNRVVGEWKLNQSLLNGEEVEIGECENQSRIEFFANGTVTTTQYYFDEEGCVSDVYTEDWEYLGNNVYRFTDEEGSYNATLIFSNNNNSFTITEEDEEGTYSSTFVRV